MRKFFGFIAVVSGVIYLKRHQIADFLRECTDTLYN